MVSLLLTSVAQGEPQALYMSFIIRKDGNPKTNREQKRKEEAILGSKPNLFC